MIIALYMAGEIGKDQRSVDTFEVVANAGVVGDRYFGKNEYPGQNLTLIESEQIQRYNEEYNESIDLADTRRNIITKGINLNELVGKEFRVGEVTLLGVELCEPCTTLGQRLTSDNMSQAAVVKAFISRGGLRVDVVSDGTISVGDRFENTPATQSIIESTQHWIQTVVIGLNLCPFAKQELMKNRIRFSVSEAISESELLKDLDKEFELLLKDSAVETTVLIHPKVLEDFLDYNEFLYHANEALVKNNLEGVFQLASFHPKYQFGGTQVSDVENYSNRSPYPSVHILREGSLETALENYPDSELIPERNIKLLNELGITKMKNLLEGCTENVGTDQ
ncbi:MAG: DUF1415 family protein [Pseudomonadales bacterium]|nr:DUF1415 family protein [Pseudomonadales bacterium]